MILKLLTATTSSKMWTRIITILISSKTFTRIIISSWRYPSPKFQNIKTATSIVKIDILNQIVVVEYKILYRAIYASESLIYLLPLNVFRIDSFNFIAKVGGHLHDDIIIRVNVFNDINVIIMRVYIFEDVVAVRSFKIIDNSFKKAR